MRVLFLLTLLTIAATAVSARSVTLKAGNGKYYFDRGRLDRLDTPAGKVVAGGGTSSAINFGGRWQVPDQHRTVGGNRIESEFTRGNIKGATLTTEYSHDTSTGDLVFIQRGTTPRGGLEAVRWCVGRVPLDWTVIVPNAGGMKIDRHTPDDRLSSAGPMFWEFPLVIYENPKGGGFYVFSDDTEWPFTSVEVRRTDRGFESSFTTWNLRPFKNHKSIQSMRWKINTFSGDWREPAARIREIWRKKFRAASPAQPDWVDKIDLVIFESSMRPERIQALIDHQKINPERTLVYLSHWRGYEFDRHYPSYDKLASRTMPMIRFLKEKGFRVMLHMNWFSIDRNHPFYEKVKYALVRNADGSPKCYSNLRKNPPIINDYVNPASPEWRALFVSQMKQLVEMTGADGIHLDQNQHCHNYDGGVINGMSMIDGTLALHRELREALPQVALSSEGSNGLIARYTAFAQRTIWSLTPQQVDIDDYQRYHPISNYLFSPGVTAYGWLGVGDPSLRNGQLYAAWRDGLSRIGTIPTIRTLFLKDLSEVAAPKGFRAVEYAEMNFIRENQLRPDFDGKWPRGVRMPWRSTNGGHNAVMLDDGSFIADDGSVIGRTLLRQREFSGSNAIHNNWYYDAKAAKGLDPARYYAVGSAPRDLAAFHVESLPPELTVGNVRISDSAIRFSILPQGEPVLDLVREFTSATFASEGPDGTWRGNSVQTGALQKRGTMILMRPPARLNGKKIHGRAQTEATGVMSADWKLRIPAEGSTRFFSQIIMHGNSLGNGASDGVLYRVEAVAANGRTLKKESFFDCRGMELADNKLRDFELDLTPLAGQQITLTLSLGAGPAGNATSDDALWASPRVEKMFSGNGKVELVAPFQVKSISSRGTSIPFEQQGSRVTFTAPLPGDFTLNRK